MHDATEMAVFVHVRNATREIAKEIRTEQDITAVMLTYLFMGVELGLSLTETHKKKGETDETTGMVDD